MGAQDQLSRGAGAARLARGAADWLLGSTAADPGEASLYHGLAGVVLALHEANQHFGDDRYAQAVARSADALSAVVDGLEGSSLYFGLAGVAVALRALGRDAAADRGLKRVRDRFDGQRWNQMFELSQRLTGPRAGSTGRYGHRRPGRTTSHTAPSASFTHWRRWATPPAGRT